MPLQLCIQDIRVGYMGAVGIDAIICSSVDPSRSCVNEHSAIY